MQQLESKKAMRPNGENWSCVPSDKAKKLTEFPGRNLIGCCLPARTYTLSFDWLLVVVGQ